MKKTEILVTVAVLVLFLTILLHGCVSTLKSESELLIDMENRASIDKINTENRASNYLPQNATDIVSHGKGWVEFSLITNSETNRYLHHRSGSGYVGFESMTLIK